MTFRAAVPTFPTTSHPKPGETIEIAPGVHWFSTFLPFRLRAINLWLIEGSDGWTMVDCGYPLREVREQIEASWSSTLKGLPVKRLVVSHHHPDHVGNCRWICERWGIVPTMTRTEHDRAQIMMSERWGKNGGERVAFWRKHGLPESAGAEINEHWDRHRDLFEPLADSWEQVRDGDIIPIGASGWQVIVAQGHAPEQALLYSPERNLLISGDQILAKITPNVSVFHDEPDAEPLALFLESNQRIAQICGDPLVLPSHNLPFFGLHSRIQALEAHHEERLAAIESELQRMPQMAATMIPTLFGKLNGHEIGFAIGEILSHLHHLVAHGRAEEIEQEGQVIFAPA